MYFKKYKFLYERKFKKGEKYLKNYKKNEKNKILDSYIPSQEWSDKTIEFLEKPYIRITNNVKIPVK